MKAKEKYVMARIYAILEYLDGRGMVITDTAMLENELTVLDFKNWEITE